MNNDPANDGVRRPPAGLRATLWLVGLAFVFGIIVTGVFIRQYRQWLPQSAQAMLDPAAGQGGTAAGADPSAAFEPPPEAGIIPRSFDGEALNARQAAITAELAALEARATVIDRDSRAAAGNAARAEALLVAFAARRAVDRGAPLGSVEAALRLRFGAAQPGAVAAIVQASRAPVTIEDLRLALDAIGPELATGIGTDGWWPSLRREISSLIVIRRQGTPSPRAVDRLERVRRLLDARQVAAALSEVALLPGAPQAGRWMAAARRYLQTQAALDTIETAAIINPPTVATLQPASPQPPAQSVGQSVGQTTETTASATLSQ